MRQAILLVAYGTSNDRAQNTLQNFSKLVKERFSLWTIRWAYTSFLLREKMAEAKQKSDSVLQALKRLSFEKFTHIAVQPLQVIPGKEYNDVVELVDSINDSFISCSLGKPLLSSDDDIAKTASAVIEHLPVERDKDEHVILMGHGAKHKAVSKYKDLADEVYKLDNKVHIGSMNGAVLLEDILPVLDSKKVWLMPLLSTIGRHVLYDMAGEHENSWKYKIEAAGHICEPILKGTAEYPVFIKLWLDHLEQAINQMKRN